ncbi:histidine phosphatase family protein [Alcaligenaceae bacterium LF4-65]|uniref:Histidine phosphatase family protein n=1 Tax=Zwartia hollandica TaxID=324606 RepID=A0A953N9Y8_9BURK|nr:histidine phosphatase family protein [Zwartia hollandica]MBZ1350979.1 histidine phosphatase family protein [Zwartia hollandica]
MFNNYSVTVLKKIFLMLLLGLSAIGVAQADLLGDLTDGQHVLMIRHADAPGVGDPTGYKLDQCATQRNLGEYGRRQSVAIGQWLADRNVQSAKMFSSAWCRCIDTATLMNKGPVKIEAALGSFFGDMSRRDMQNRALQSLIASNLKAHPKQPLIYVTHHVNIEAFTGQAIGVGDIVVARVTPEGRYVSHQTFASPRP